MATVDYGYVFEYEASQQVIAARFHATVTGAACVRFYREAPRALAHVAIRAVLIDFTAVTAFDVSAQTVHYLSGLRPLLPNAVPRVVIAPQDVAYGMLRWFQSIAIEKRRLELHRTAHAAYAALGLAAPHFEPVPPLES